jgi:hypothetical protein
MLKEDISKFRCVARTLVDGHIQDMKQDGPSQNFELMKLLSKLQFQEVNGHEHDNSPKGEEGLKPKA